MNYLKYKEKIIIIVLYIFFKNSTAIPKTLVKDLNSFYTT